AAQQLAARLEAKGLSERLPRTESKRRHAPMISQESKLLISYYDIMWMWQPVGTCSKSRFTSQLNRRSSRCRRRVGWLEPIRHTAAPSWAERRLSPSWRCGNGRAAAER